MVRKVAVLPTAKQPIRPSTAIQDLLCTDLPLARGGPPPHIFLKVLKLNLFKKGLAGLLNKQDAGLTCLMCLLHGVNSSDAELLSCSGVYALACISLPSFEGVGEQQYCATPNFTGKWPKGLKVKGLHGRKGRFLKGPLNGLERAQTELFVVHVGYLLGPVQAPLCP